MQLIRNFKSIAGVFATMILAITASTNVQAQTALEDLEIVGQPIDGAMGWQPAATQLARELQWLDGLLLIIITAITVLVTGLMFWVIVRYNRKVNETPSTFTHNSPLEIAWTIVPVIILVFLGAYSLPVLFNQQEIPEADITIKVTGYQWYWGYEYVDEGIDFTSYMIGTAATLDPDQDSDVREYVLDDEMRSRLARSGYTEAQWLLATDTAVVVPVGATVVMQLTGADVIHSWAMPAFGVKQDAVPGRLSQLWFPTEREGIYFGQCSELCGAFHSYMPITVKVVSQEVYDEWLARVRDDSSYDSW